MARCASQVEIPSESQSSQPLHECPEHRSSVCRCGRHATSPRSFSKPPHPFPTTPTTLECAVGRRTWLARMQRLRLQPSEERARGPVCGLSLSACIMRSARGTQRSGWGPQSSAAVAERLAARLEAQAPPRPGATRRAALGAVPFLRATRVRDRAGAESGVWDWCLGSWSLNCKVLRLVLRSSCPARRGT